METCKHCEQTIDLLDGAPAFADTGDGAGWATDHCGDVEHDFICTSRDGRSPHEPAE